MHAHYHIWMTGTFPFVSILPTLRKCVMRSWYIPQTGPDSLGRHMRAQTYSKAFFERQACVFMKDWLYADAGMLAWPQIFGLFEHAVLTASIDNSTAWKGCSVEMFQRVTALIRLTFDHLLLLRFIKQDEHVSQYYLLSFLLWQVPSK